MPAPRCADGSIARRRIRQVPSPLQPEIEAASQSLAECANYIAGGRDIRRAGDVDYCARRYDTPPDPLQRIDAHQHPERDDKQQVSDRIEGEAPHWQLPAQYRYRTAGR